MAPYILQNVFTYILLFNPPKQAHEVALFSSHFRDEES